MENRMIPHLHLHSHFSVLDGLGKVEDIVKKAKAIGANAVAITDHASIGSLPELFKQAKEYGIKPIIGCEFYLVEENIQDKDEIRYHLSVWAKNWNGVKSIMRQLTLANKQFYKRPRLTFEQALEFEDCIIGTGCAIGVMAHPDYHDIILDLRTAYRGNLYLEVMPHEIIEGANDLQKQVNDRCLELSTTYKLPLVATNDAHYVNKEDSVTHEVLLAVQSRKAWTDPSRWRFSGENFYMRDHKEMFAAFKEIGFPEDAAKEAIKGAFEIADKIDVQLPEFEVHLPTIYEDEKQAFYDKVLDGYENLVKGKVADDKPYRERLSYEIAVIAKLGFIPYFLMVEDVIAWARSQGIMVGPGRGSAAGSLICYLMGITQVDPIKFGLFFERFLNPERIDLPDIDIDFMDSRREEVFTYLREKYGKDKTANISTYGVLTAKSAFRDVARVFGIPPVKTNSLSKQIEDVESFEKVPELNHFRKHNPMIIEQTEKLVGTIRQTGVHACGMIVSSNPLNDVTAIEHRSGADVINWDMRDAESFGLLKMDILGLSTLTVLKRAKDMIKENHKADIVFTDIPLDDEKTFELFSAGDGVGVFQFENGGMQSLLRELNASDFSTITDTTALYRPGSLNSGQTAAYCRIAKGDEYEDYVCEELKPILGPTRGILVYQEQIMQIFNQLAGFSWAQADKMRKIIGKKLGKGEFEKHREAFVSGCEEKDISSVIASELFDKMAEFAAYSFNKSHAVAYTMISYWAMYLKAHYPLEFYTAQLNSSSDDKIGIISREAEKRGMPIARPDINMSEALFTIQDGVIVPPFGIVKGIGERAAEEILKAREESEVRAFTSVDDFKERVYKRVVNKKVQDLLFRSGAYESLGLKEEDEEIRNKNFTELLPTYSTLPSLSKIGDIDKPALKSLLTKSTMCAKEESHESLMPKFHGNPSVMVINNPVKGEKDLLTTESGKWYLSALSKYGLKSRDIYYTAPIKCAFPKGETACKECQAKCLDYLREEIKAVRPKIIVCHTANVFPIFSVKDSMGAVDGKVIFNKEFNCYILFCYSPQYAFYNEDKQPKFFNNLSTLGEILA
jgi:DNA polymerase-3 subunit alpha